MNHLMIDIETLSNRPNAVICAIGAVFFEPSTGKIGPSFYQTIDPRTSQSRGADSRQSGKTARLRKRHQH